MLMNALNLLNLYKRSCHKINKSDLKEMRKEFKLLIKKRLKIRIKETKSRESTENPLTAKLFKGSEQSGELETRHLPCLGMVNKLTNERLIPDSLELPDVNLRY
jgi:hypothetical protein